jgi:hypothetical protein
MIPLREVVKLFGLLEPCCFLVSPRRPNRPATFASFTTDFAPGLAGVAWVVVSIADRDLLVPKSGEGVPARTRDVLASQF